MEISYNHLCSYLAEPVTLDETIQILTSTGLEVESVDKVGIDKDKLQGLIVGEVLELHKHPNADRLRVCKVNLGDKIATIVCGAANVDAGQKVVIATPGTTLYPTKGDSFEIKLSKIRGEVSEGMICAEDEIGIGTSHDGIMVLPAETAIGIDFSTLYSGELDYILGIGITPNRTDALSYIGIAKDISAYKNIDVNLGISKLGLEKQETNSNSHISIEVADEKACPRYTALVVENSVVQESPQSMKDVLTRSGIQSINSIVDITNYVMLETGQPMHAFDYDTIVGKKIIVRFAVKGEKMIALNGAEIEFDGSELVIANESEIMALAGVTGSKKHGISETTTRIVLESAYFNNSLVRAASKKSQQKSDSSYRFERGTDPNATSKAIKKAATLLAESGTAQFVEGIIDVYPSKIENIELQLLYSNFKRVLGFEIEPETIVQILKRLDFEIEYEHSEGLQVHVPSYRVDVTREIDVIEEVIRIHGYDNIPERNSISYDVSFPIYNGQRSEKIRLAHTLAGSGFLELVTNSLVKDNPELKEQVKLLNPLSEVHSAMRFFAYESGLSVISYNNKRGSKNLQLFEFTKTYSKVNNEYSENEFLALWTTNADKKNAQNAFFEMKSLLIAVLKQTGYSNIKQEKAEFQGMNNVLSLISENGTTLATLGSISGTELEKLEIEQSVIFAQIPMQIILEKNRMVKMTEPFKFPTVNRDLALVIDEDTDYEAIRTSIEKANIAELLEYKVFDIYRSDSLGANKKSYGINFTFVNNTKTLTESEIETFMKKLITNFEKLNKAVIRN